MNARGLPIPLTVIGGYLGAGKTTLVNELLRRPEGRRFGLIVNDLGAVNIDASLIESETDDTISLANGCVCCSIVDGFEQALATLREPERGIDQVIVEVSGVGDPWKVAQWGRTPGFSLDAVVVLADVERIRDLAADGYVGETVRQQLSGADLVVLTKVDLAPADVDPVRRWLDDEGIDTGPVVAPARGARSIVDLLGAVAPAGRSSRHGDTDTDTGIGAIAGVETRPGLADHLVAATEPGIHDRSVWTAWLASAPEGVVRVKGFATLPDGVQVEIQQVGRRQEIVRWKREPVADTVVAIALGSTDAASFDSWLAEQ